MAKLELLNNSDGVPLAARKIYPIGTRIRWWQKDRLTDYIIKITGYDKCTDPNCVDCDKDSYIEEDGGRRCHYRAPKSGYGLCYWEEYNG